MDRNITPPQPQAGQPCGLSVAPDSAPSFLTGTGLELLEACEEIDIVRQIAEELWDILDDIDTASDAIKPTDEAGYRRFYEYAMKLSAERHNHLVSDGTFLFLPNVKVCRTGTNTENSQHP